MYIYIFSCTYIDVIYYTLHVVFIYTTYVSNNYFSLCLYFSLILSCTLQPAYDLCTQCLMLTGKDLFHLCSLFVAFMWCNNKK